jgi:hypothetical protein
VFKSRPGDHSIRCVERGSIQLTLTIQDAPAVSDGMGNGQDAIAKPSQKIGLKPRLQFGSLPARRKDDEPLADFSKGDGAQKRHPDGLCFEPLYDEGLWTIPTKFGRYVGVE